MKHPAHSYCQFSSSDIKSNVSDDFSDAYKLSENMNKPDKENFIFSLPYKHGAFNTQFPEYDGIEVSRNILQPKPILALQSTNLNKSLDISSKSISNSSVSKLLDTHDEVLSSDSCFCAHPIIKPPKTINTNQPLRTISSIRSCDRIKDNSSPTKDLSNHLDTLNIKNESTIKLSQTHSYTPESSPVLNTKGTIFDNSSFVPDLAISYKKLCNECNTDNAEFILTSCGHKICQKCLSVLISSTPINLCTCYICHKPITSFINRSSLEPSLSSNKLQSIYNSSVIKDNFFTNSFDIKHSRHCAFPEKNTESSNITTDSLLKESLLKQNPFSDISTLVIPQDWTCLKISNIPWDLSIEAIHEFLGKNARIAPYNIHSQPIHFIMDRMSAKTQSERYVELSSRNDAQRLAERRSGKLLGSRNVVLEIATQEELMNRIFPKWKGEWKGVNPCADENLKSLRQFSVPKAEIVTREELNSLINHVKTYRSPYSRKCPQRPFEDFISILAKFPWHKGSFYTLSQRDLLHSSLINHLHTTEILSFLMYNGFKIDGLHSSEKEVYSLSDVAKIEISYINTKLLEYTSSVSSTTLH
ncbi:hypothetical protein PCK1_002031 [Pneumocystis canis]|nr:hypothetical protein PCK1_002031 [Pneumocystis canis]